MLDAAELLWRPDIVMHQITVNVSEISVVETGRLTLGKETNERGIMGVDNMA